MTDHRQRPGPPPPLHRPGAAFATAPIQPRMAGAFNGANAAARPGPPPPAFAGSSVAQPRMAAAPVPPRPPAAIGRAAPVQARMAATRSGPPAPAFAPGVAICRAPAPGARTIQRAKANDDDEEMGEFEMADRSKIGASQYNFSATRSKEEGYWTGKQVSTPGKSDLAATHLVPDAKIKRLLFKAVEDWWGGDLAGYDRVKRLVANTKQRNAILLTHDDFDIVSKGIGKISRLTAHDYIKASSLKIDHCFNQWASALYSGLGMTDAMQNLHDSLSLAPGNLPDYGLHSEFNQPVSDRIHVNIRENPVSGSGSLSPLSLEATDSGVEGVAVSKHGNYIITRQGGFFPVSKLNQTALNALKRSGYDRTGIQSPK